MYGLTNCKPCWLFTPLEFGNNSASILIPQILIKCELKRWRTNSYSTDGLWWSSPRNTIIRGKNNLAINCSTSEFQYSLRIRGYQRWKTLILLDALFYLCIRQAKSLGYVDVLAFQLSTFPVCWCLPIFRNNSFRIRIYARFGVQSASLHVNFHIERTLRAESWWETIERGIEVTFQVSI